MAELFNLLVDSAVLFDVGVGMGDVGLRLIVVVVGDKVFHRVFREKLLEFAAKLGGKGFVVGQHQGGAVGFGDDVCHGKRLSGTGYAHEGLFPKPQLNSLRQLGDGLRLVAGGDVF